MEGAVGTLADAGVAHQFVVPDPGDEQRSIVRQRRPIVAVAAVRKVQAVRLADEVGEDVGGEDC